jgi:hypothetical protein
MGDQGADGIISKCIIKKQGLVVGSCEQGNEPSGSIKEEEFLE